jgi:hypothetical protein
MTKETQRMSHYVSFLFPCHHTMALCCSNFIPKDASVSTQQLLNLSCYGIFALYHGDSKTKTLVLKHAIP